MPFGTATGRRYHLPEEGTIMKAEVTEAIVGRLRRLRLPPHHFCRRHGSSRLRPIILDDFGPEGGDSRIQVLRPPSR